jgi:hypothetical protein
MTTGTKKTSAPRAPSFRCGQSASRQRNTASAIAARGTRIEHLRGDRSSRPEDRRAGARDRRAHETISRLLSTDEKTRLLFHVDGSINFMRFETDGLTQRDFSKRWTGRTIQNRE